jgi:hypothetical protein
MSTCYSCGVQPAPTREHVISKTLIPKPFPPNLLTVPSCAACNNSLSKDEEYLRDRLSATAQGFKAGQWGATLRSIKIPQAHGKKMSLYGDMFRLSKSVMTEDGPSNIAIRIDKDRTERVAVKIVKGLFFSRFAMPLRGVEFFVDIPSIHLPDRNEKVICHAVQIAIQNLSWKRKFGSYTCAGCCIGTDDTRGGIWLIRLFGEHLIFVCTVPLILHAK